MKENATATFYKQWVEDCQLRGDVSGDPVPCPTTSTSQLALCSQWCKEQVSKAVREKGNSDSVLLCCKFQLLWKVQELRET